MQRRRLTAAYWIGFCWLLLLVPLWSWATRDLSTLRFPATPVDRVREDYAIQWRFLWEARHSVLPGSTYTVRASTPAAETTLFLFSLGLCTRRTPLPSSYYGRPTPDLGRKAHYVIALGDFTGNERGLKLVTKFRDGSVYERRGGESK